MESSKTRISRNLTDKKEMDMEKAYVKKTQQQYHKKSPPIRTKEKRSAQEHTEKRSEAGDEGSTWGTIKTTA